MPGVGKGKSKKKKKSKSKGASRHPYHNLAALPEKVLDRVVAHLEEIHTPFYSRPPKYQRVNKGMDICGYSDSDTSSSEADEEEYEAKHKEYQAKLARRMAAEDEDEDTDTDTDMDDALGRCYSAVALTCRALRLPAQRLRFRSINFIGGTGARGPSSVYHSCDKVVKGNASACLLIKRIGYRTGGEKVELKELQLLQSLLAKCTNLVQFGTDLSEATYEWINVKGNDVVKRQALAKYLVAKQLLQAGPFTELHASHFLPHEGGILPSRPLKRLILDIDTGPSAPPLHMEVVGHSWTGPLYAEHVCLRNFVCHNHTRDADSGEYRGELVPDPGADSGSKALTPDEACVKEADLAKDLFRLFNKPKSLTLERCRFSPEVFRTILAVPLASTLVTLELHELVRREAEGLTGARCKEARFPLDRLTRLKHLKLGTVDTHIIDGVPPRLVSVTFIVVNCCAALDWLSNAGLGTSGHSNNMQLPADCVIDVCPRLTFSKVDGPSEVGDIEESSSWGRIKGEVADIDETLERAGRKSVPVTFARALHAASKYCKSDLYKWRADRGLEEDTMGMYQNYLWGHPPDYSAGEDYEGYDDDEYEDVHDEDEEDDDVDRFREEDADTDGDKDEGSEELARGIRKSFKGAREEGYAKQQRAQQSEHGKVPGQNGKDAAQTVDPDAAWSWSDED